VPAPVVTALDPDGARVGGPNLTLRVRGAGFDPAAVIVFGGGDEPTTWVADGEVTTIVQPSTASGPAEVTVTVRNADATEAPPLLFSFTVGDPVPHYVTATEVLERLRLPANHPDAAYVIRCTAAANELVDDELAVVLDVPYPESVWRAALGVAIRVYRFKDAESDVANAWSDTGALRIPRDPLAGYRDLLTPWCHGSKWAPA